METLAAIGVLGALVVIHELGHFLAARLQGIHANRFSIGFGPVLFKHETPETEYALRLLPLGGYVGFPDEDPDSTIPKDDPNLLKNRPIRDRALVMVAGVVANLVFTYIFLLLLVLFTGIEEATPGIRVSDIKPQSPAATAGLKAGDTVLAAGGQDLGIKSIEQFKTVIASSANQPITLKVQRAGQTLTSVVTPDLKGKIGIALVDNIRQRPPKSALEPFAAAAQKYGDIAGTTLSGFGQLFTGKVGIDQLSSPVGIVKVTADVAAANPINLLYMAALISFNLGLLNILPIPGLDGSHLMFLAFEAIRGKPVSEKIQNGLLQAGLACLMLLVVTLIFRDSFNWITKGSPF